MAMMRKMPSPYTFPLEVMKQIWEEAMINPPENWPNDALRGAALVAEEAGEALKEALDYTREHPAEPEPEQLIRNLNRLRNETVQTAANAVKQILAIDRWTREAENAQR